ncbi:YhgE/Pip domain-containing protein [Paenibacillus sp. CC-CFT747]|nr:YhgE/Pip domain-containing protein [Paenibacillus sp. CC-CFT747]
MGDLTQGAAALNQGLGSLQKGTAGLSGGLGQLEAGHKQLEQGAASAKDGAQKLQAGLSRSADGAAELKAGAAQLEQGLKAYAAAHAAAAQAPAADAPKAGSEAAGAEGGTPASGAVEAAAKDAAQLQQLIAAAHAVAAGADASAAGQQQLAAGAAQLSAGTGQLADGTAAFGGKLAEAASAGRQLDAGAQQLAAGGRQLQAGLGQLGGGVDRLASGAAQLGEGTHKLSEGAGSVASGSSELSGKLAEASGKTSELKGSDKLYQTFADPVEVEEDKVGSVPNYGTGFAPYFLSLGLFVGALMLSIVFPFKAPAAPPASGFRWFTGKTLMLAAVGLAQALLADAMLLWGLGVEVQSVPLFLVYSVLTSWTFMAIIQVLVTPFNNPGRFVAVLLLILQLTTCGGSYPVELLPSSLQHVNTWLPMNYSLNGFRAVISSGNFSAMWQSAEVLVSIMIALLVITLGYFLFSYRHTYGKGRTAGSESLAS